jgi:hypothetical protein
LKNGKFRMRLTIGFVSFMLTLIGCTVLSSQAKEYNTAVLRGLDKVTARVSTFNAPIGSAIRFGPLEIITRACDKRPPEETPESAVFIDVSEVHAGEPTESIYRGWMFASSPALAAMEHPVYDVWVLDCITGNVESGLN